MGWFSDALQALADAVSGGGGGGDSGGGGGGGGDAASAAAAYQDEQTAWLNAQKEAEIRQNARWGATQPGSDNGTSQESGEEKKSEEQTAPENPFDQTESSETGLQLGEWQEQQKRNQEALEEMRGYDRVREAMGWTSGNDSSNSHNAFGMTAGMGDAFGTGDTSDTSGKTEKERMQSAIESQEKNRTDLQNQYDELSLRRRQYPVGEINPQTSSMDKKLNELKQQIRETDDTISRMRSRYDTTEWEERQDKADLTDTGTEKAGPFREDGMPETGKSITQEERQEQKEKLRNEEQQLQEEYQELNQRVLWGRIGKDYTQDDLNQLSELEDQINRNRKEQRALQAEVSYGSVLGLNTMTGFEKAGLGVTKMLDWLVGEGSIPWGLATETATLFGADLTGKNPVSALKRQGEQEVEGWAARAAASAQGNDVAEMIGQHTQSISESLPFVVLNLMSMGTAGMASAAGQTAGLQYTAALNSSTGMEAISEMSRYGLRQLVQDPGAQYSFLSSFGENYEDAVENGASEIEATLYAAVNSSYNAMIEVGGSDEGLGGMQLLPKEVKGALENGRTGIVMDWVKSVGQEIGEEELQGIMERGLKQIYTDVPAFSTTDENAIFNPQVMQDTAINTAIDTAIMGGMQTGINAAALRAEQNRARRAERERYAQATNDTSRAEAAARAAEEYQKEQNALLLAAQEHEAEASRARAAGDYQSEQTALLLAEQERQEAEAKAREVARVEAAARAAEDYQGEQTALRLAEQERQAAASRQRAAEDYQSEQTALREAEQQRQAAQEAETRASRARAAGDYQSEQTALREAEQARQEALRLEQQAAASRQRAAEDYQSEQDALRKAREEAGEGAGLRLGAAEEESTSVNTDPEEHTAAEQIVIDEYQGAVDDELMQFVQEVITDEGDSSNGKTFPLSPVSERASADIAEITGIDTTGYATVIQGSMVKHIVNEHGPEGTTDHSMRDLNDLARIQYVLDNYDSVEAGKGTKAYRTNRGNGKQGPAKTVVFSKAVNGTYYVVEAVPDTKARTTYIVSAYMAKNKTDAGHAADANAPTRTAKTEGVQTSDTYNVSNPLKDVNSRNEGAGLQLGAAEEGGSEHVQEAAETQQGILGQEEAEQGTGENRITAGEESEPGAAESRRAESGLSWAGEDLSDGSGRRDAGQRAGGPTGRLDRNAGTGSRDQGAGGSGRARTGESYGDALRRSGARQLSSREFGLERGTDTPTFYEITEDLLTDDLKQLRYGIGNSTGCSVEFVSGPMQVTGRNGRVQNIGGFYDPANRRIVVRADSRRYTAEQIARHEEFHALADQDPHLVDEIRDRITERFGRKEMERIVRGYQIARRGINDITSGVDAETREAQELLEEIFADANGNMNAFGLGANRFAFNTWTTITNRENRRSQTANGTKTTRGPPRYSDAGDGGTSNSTRVEPGPKVKDNNEKNDLAQVLVRNIQRLEIMQPVTELSGEEMNDRSKTPREQIMDFFDSIGNRVTRESFGDVALGTYGADAMINHRPLNRAKMVTIQAVPDVIRYGNLIGYDPNWKNRGYQTFIFGAPVTVAGKTVYVAAVVDQRENKEFYLNECVDSEGNYVRIVEGPTDSAKSGVTVHDGLTTGPVEPSEDSVPQSQKESKQSFSATKEDPSGNTKSGVTVPDGLTREPDRSSEGPSDNTKIGLTVRNGITEGPLEPSDNSVPQSQDNSKQSFSVDEDEDRSGWNEDFRKRVEDTEELIDDLQEFYQSVDEYDENRLSQEELENYTDYNRYSRNVSMYGGSEITDSLNELAKDATGERRTEIFKLMERMLPHLDALEQQRYTGDRNDPEWQPTAFSRWYNKRHPSLYYPGYQPGDLFDRGKADSWTAWDNQDREKEYLQELLDSGKLMEPELTEAREFLDRLEKGEGTFYSIDEDTDIFKELERAEEERDALQERLNRIGSQDGRYIDTESGTEFDEDEVRELAEALEEAENRYNELLELVPENETERITTDESEERDDGSLSLGKADEEEAETEDREEGQALSLEGPEPVRATEDERDRTIRELQEVNRQLEKEAAYWRKQGRITGEGEETAKRSDVRRFTDELTEHADYQGDRAELQQRVQELADTVVSNNKGEGLSWEDIQTKARAIADELVDNSYNVVDPEADTRKGVLDTLKTLKIRPDSMWTSDFGDWESFRRKQIGKLVFSRDGQSIDDVYHELQARFGEGLFPEDVTAGSDQVNRIVDVLDQLSPRQVYNFLDDTDAQMASDYYTNRITDEVLFGNIREELTKADRNYNRVKERMMNAENRLREQKKESARRIDELQRMQRYEVKAALDNQRQSIREREEKQKLRKNISQTGKRLLKYMTENSGKNPIPEPMKQAIGKVLLDLDISGGMEKNQKKRYLQDMQQVARIVTQQNAYLEGNTDAWAGMYLDLPADIQQELDEHLQNVQKAMDEAEARGKVWNPNMMNAEELTRLDEILTVLSSAVTNANEILSDARGAKISEEATKGIREIDSLGADRKRSTRGETINRFLRFQNTTPYYFFKRLGKAGADMFERIQNGWDRFAFNAKQVVDFANKTYTAKEARDIQNTTYEFQLRRRGDMSAGFDKPETVTMTKAQIMSLYCLWKREQAQGHLLGAGIRIADFQAGKSTVKQAENYLLDLQDITKILSKLTDRDREIADGLQKYMNTVGSDWGNEVSMKRFGIRSFTEENYFPIQTDDRTRPVRNPESDSANLYRLLNMSFTKNTTRGASNSVVIDNIFDVFANHMADMAKYNGLGLPMLDAMKWFSFNQTSELNEEGQYGYESVQKSVERAFGKEARNYFTTFMKDLNGVREGGRGEEFGSRMLSSYKVAAVGANIRVALLQPTSYLRAGAVLDKKYLVKGLGRSNRSGREEAMKWSGTAVWKDLGFYDTNINAGLREMIKHMGGVREQVQELSMKGAELGDKTTWGALWNACRAEQEDKGFSGDELMEQTARRFREVVYRTQVMDSTMTRSHVMRQKGAYAGMVTAFMSEPTLSYNMLLDAYSSYENDVRKNMNGKNPGDRRAEKEAREKAWEKNKGAVGKAVAAYTSTAVLSAIVESIVDAARDDDEYANFLERLAQKLLGVNLSDPDLTAWEAIKAIPNGNLMQDLLIHNKLPVIKDFFSLLGGQSTSRMDTEWMASIIKAGQIWAETIALQMGWKDEPTKATYNGNMTTWGKIYNTLRAASQLTGLPMGNALRDVVALWNSTAGEMAPGLKVQTYDPGALKQIQYAVQDGFLTEDEAVQLMMKQELAEDETEARQMVYVWAHPDKYEDLIAAMNAGDYEGFLAAQEELGDLRFRQSSIGNAVSNEIEKQFLGADGREPIDRDQAVNMLMQYGGMIERKAEEQVQRWACELETGIPYDGISDAYLAGDITARQAKDMLMEYGGLALEKAEAQVQKWSSELETGIGYSEIGDMLFYGDISHQEAVDMYIKYGGKSQEDAEEAALKIEFRRDYGRERERAELQDMYVSGEYSREEMKEIMLKYSYSNTEDSAENSLIRWDFIGEDMSLDAVTPWQAKKWFAELEDADIDKQVYLDFAAQVKDVKGDVGEDGKTIPYSKMNKVFAIIDSLDLTPEQKDALALAGWDSNNDGYSEKNLSKAPWHDGSSSSTSTAKKKSSGGYRGSGGSRGGRRKSSGGGYGGGPALVIGSSERSADFDAILKGWKKRKYSRAQILEMMRQGLISVGEAHEILAQAQDGDEPETDGSLELGAADKLKESA